MADKFAIHGYENERERHRDNAVRALEYARQRITSALDLLNGEPNHIIVADTRHAASLVAEGYAHAQAYMALREVAFLAEPDEPSADGGEHSSTSAPPAAEGGAR